MSVIKFKNLFATLPAKWKIVILSLSLVVSSIFILLFWFSLPNPLFTDPVSTVLVSNNGTLLGAKIADDEQWRFPLQHNVPEKFATAIRLFEDKRFFYHPGVDPIALARSIYLNLKSKRIVSGGSTLSMQVIRLSRKNPARTYFEKIKEILLTFRLELGYSKNEILNLYAANAPFGGNVVGLEAAAFRYFRRSAEKLSWAESATLAVLPNNPALVHPGRNRNKLKQKRDRLLKRLLDKGFIKDLEYKLALIEELPQKPHPLPRKATHLLETLNGTIKKRQTNQHPSFISSTIDTGIQRKTARVLKQHSRNLRARGIYNIAALVVDNTSLEVLAYVGNIPADGKTNHGEAIDLIQSPRSTGSILKPFLFAAMLQNGELLPTTLVSDIPSQYYGYAPENFDRKYRGALPAAEALAKSLNIPAVRMLKKFGLQRFHDFLENIGMRTLHRNASAYGLTLILGGAEGTLWDITNMYANVARIANLGHIQNPEFNEQYQSITTIKGAQQDTGQRVELNPGSAWLTLEALLEVVRPGMEGFWKDFSSSQKIAWKTGTSYGLRDAWAIGTTPKYTVGVWAGNASGEGHPEISGINTAAPVLFDVFNFLPKSQWFYEPSFFLKEVTVCKLSGQLATPECDGVKTKIPIKTNFSDICPYHRTIHLDQTETYRVHSKCEDVSKMKHVSWFVLPPLHEYYYRKYNSGYKPLPPMRPDCEKKIADEPQLHPLQIVYPAYKTVIYIPVEMDETKSQTVFEAIHRTPKTTVYWHLDDQYLGATTNFHKLAYAPEKGDHTLILIDEKGNRVERKFKVLGKED